MSFVAFFVGLIAAFGMILSQQFPPGPDMTPYVPPYALKSGGIESRRVTIVVPAYKEQPNIRPLCLRVTTATKKAGINAEIIVVDDDSQDGTVEEVAGLRQEGYNISVLVRQEKGLSTAVLAGFELANNEVLLVMDADLQHPPESVPKLLAPLLNDDSHFSLGSRYIEGGGTKDWALHRQIISYGATILAWPLVSVSDPMSGFFAIRKSLYQTAVQDAVGKPLPDHLNPLGFKIALELMVKCAPHKAVEVPFMFRHRVKGESKLQITTQIQYLQHLAALYWYKSPRLVIAALTVACILVVVLLNVACARAPRAAKRPITPVIVGEQIDSSRRKGRKEKKGESHVETPTAADGASSDASGETDSDGAGISRRTRTGTRLRKRVQS